MSFFQGGFSAGMDKSRTFRIQEGQLEAQQQQAVQAEKQRLGKLTVEGAKQSLDVIKQLTEAADTRGIPRSDPKLNGSIEAAVRAALPNIQAGVQAGLLPPGALEMYRSQVSALVDGPTLQERTALESWQAGQKTKSQEEAKNQAEIDKASNQAWIEARMEMFDREQASKQRHGTGGGVSITLPGAVQEKAESKAAGTAIGKGRGERANLIFDRADQARDVAVAGRRMLGLLDQLEKDGGRTGAVEPTFNAVKGVLLSLGVDLETFGINPDTVGTAEAINSLSVDFALKQVAKTKGAISNAEMNLFMDSVPGLRKTPRGNRLIVQTMMRAAELDTKFAKFINGKINESGNDLSRLEEWKEEFWAQPENKLFTDKQKAELEGNVVDPTIASFDYNDPDGKPVGVNFTCSQWTEAMNKHGLQSDQLAEALGISYGVPASTFSGASRCSGK